MTTTPKPFMRRAGLIDWLGPLGFSPDQVDQMIRDGAIPRTIIPRTRTKNPRAWYKRDEIAAKLDIKLPAAN